MQKNNKTESTKKIAIIGAGFAGLSAAAYLAKEGYAVDVFEKNDQI
ncbi:MAG: FAD-dependent oxidoreductase, partial [Pedobacter sp.]